MNVGKPVSILAHQLQFFKLISLTRSIIIPNLFENRSNKNIVFFLDFVWIVDITISREYWCVFTLAITFSICLFHLPSRPTVTPKCLCDSFFIVQWKGKISFIRVWNYLYLSFLAIKRHKPYSIPLVELFKVATDNIFIWSFSCLE